MEAALRAPEAEVRLPSARITDSCCGSAVEVRRCCCTKEEAMKSVVAPLSTRSTAGFPAMEPWSLMSWLREVVTW